jgi:adenylosuccinate synthase
MDKTGRNGLRVGDILDKNFTTQYIKIRLKHQRLLDTYHFQEDITKWEEEFFDAVEFLKTLNIVNGEYFINDKINKGQKILAEGAQGTMLDIDFGTFPCVTSSNTISAGVCSGLGIAPQKIKDVIGITKAYCTRVGSGPFPTELTDQTGDFIRNAGNEFGSTTGRPRRCGWIDLTALQFACMINGVTKIVMTKADVLDSVEELKVGIGYLINGKEETMIPFQMDRKKIEPIYKYISGWNSDISKVGIYENMPKNLKSYIEFIEEFLSVPVAFISNGPATEQLLSVQ